MDSEAMQREMKARNHRSMIPSTSSQQRTVQHNPRSTDSPPPTTNSLRRTTICNSNWQTQACNNSKCSTKGNNSHIKHPTLPRRCSSKTPDEEARARTATTQDGTQRGTTEATSNHSNSKGRERTTQFSPPAKPSARNSSRVGTRTTTTTVGRTEESATPTTTARHARHAIRRACIRKAQHVKT